MIQRTDVLTSLRENPGAFSAPAEHAGAILKEEYLDPLGITAYALAKATGMSQTRVGEILRGTRAITADAAVRIAVALGTTAEFWVGLQADYELRQFLADEGLAVIGTVKPLSERHSPEDRTCERSADGVLSAGK